MKQKLLPDILKELIDGSNFILEYNYVTPNSDGTFTISGICDLHYIQINDVYNINGVDYTVQSYTERPNTITLIGATAPPAQGSFNLKPIYFLHGTPLEANIEAGQTPIDILTPLIYLMEPFNSEMDYTYDSSIDSYCDFTLCFLTQGDIFKWQVDEIYTKCIKPMEKLMRDFIDVFKESNLFYMQEQRAKARYYTRFGINVREYGTGELYFSENLAGVAMDIKLAIYKVEACCTDELIAPVSAIELREDGNKEIRDGGGYELRQEAISA